MSCNCYVLLFGKVFCLSNLDGNYKMLKMRRGSILLIPFSKQSFDPLQASSSTSTVATESAKCIKWCPSSWKITLIPQARFWLVTQVWVMDCAAASTAPRYTESQRYPYNPSPNSALICASYRDDTLKSSYTLRYPFMQLGSLVLQQNLLWIHNLMLVWLCSWHPGVQLGSDKL